jgi:hypothetical protein
MKGGCFAQSQVDGNFVILLSETEESFHLVIPRDLLVEIPELNEENEEDEILASFPPSHWIDLMKKANTGVYFM